MYLRPLDKLLFTGHFYAKNIAQAYEHLVEPIVPDHIAVCLLQEILDLALQGFISEYEPIGVCPFSGIEALGMAAQEAHQAIVVAGIADEDGMIGGKNVVQRLGPIFMEFSQFVLSIHGVQQQVPVDLDDRGPLNLMAHIGSQGLVADHHRHNLGVFLQAVLRQMVKIRGDHHVVYGVGHQQGQIEITAAGPRLLYHTFQVIVAVPVAFAVILGETPGVKPAIIGVLILVGDGVLPLPPGVFLRIPLRQFPVPQIHQILSGLNAGGF